MESNESSGASQWFFFSTVWVILMEIGWDEQCPRATGPSPPFLGMGSWSGWVWKEASDFFAWPSGKSELCRAGLDLILNNDLSREQLKWNHFHFVYSFLPRWGSLSVCKILGIMISFYIIIFGDFCRTAPALVWMVWFNRPLVLRRPRIWQKSFSQYKAFCTQVVTCFSDTTFLHRALPAFPPVYCLSLFGSYLSLCSLFMNPIQKCHSFFYWAASLFTHTYTKHPQIPTAKTFKKWKSDVGA